ncbi:hypothetical protein J2751_002057 [Halorubrum alkaliphilum]|uniref:DUF7999 domain-containing protein n=1 Tax=Halorubrum alkaliphilum TaxID=261290 RepID=A0A8T4GH87_9EURY|nr:hypothetical protein [Halorubrum alkaliphilum]MBP1923020.1 hypothetical protein [Halorubrum alkaliphilum]
MNRTGKYTVVKSCNDHGAVTLRDHPRNGTFHVVEYGDSDAEEALADLDAGSVVQLELERTGRRGNAWRVAAAETVESG